MLNNEQAKAVKYFCRSLIQNKGDLFKIQKICVDYLGRLKDSDGQTITTTETITYRGRSVVINITDSNHNEADYVDYILDMIAGKLPNPNKPDSGPLVPRDSYLAAIYTLNEDVFRFMDLVRGVKNTQNLEYSLDNLSLRYQGGYKVWFQEYAKHIPDDFMLLRFTRKSLDNSPLYRFTILPRDRAQMCVESFDAICRFLNLKESYFIIDGRTKQKLETLDLPEPSPVVNLDSLRPQNESKHRYYDFKGTSSGDMEYIEPPCEDQLDQAQQGLAPSQSSQQTQDTAQEATATHLNDYAEQAQQGTEKSAAEQNQPKMPSWLIPSDAAPQAATQQVENSESPATTEATAESVNKPEKKAKEVVLPTLMPEEDFDCFN